MAYELRLDENQLTTDEAIPANSKNTNISKQKNINKDTGVKQPTVCLGLQKRLRLEGKRGVKSGKRPKH